VQNNNAISNTFMLQLSLILEHTKTLAVLVSILLITDLNEEENSELFFRTFIKINYLLNFNGPFMYSKLRFSVIFCDFKVLSLDSV